MKRTYKMTEIKQTLDLLFNKLQERRTPQSVLDALEYATACVSMDLDRYGDSEINIE